MWFNFYDYENRYWFYSVVKSTKNVLYQNFYLIKVIRYIPYKIKIHKIKFLIIIYDLAGEIFHALSKTFLK